jgi:hypothetical protein
MGLYKLCEHDGRNRDRCEHPWWGSFRGVRVSLSKWTDREIRSKAEAGAALDELRLAIRARKFDPSGLTPVRATPSRFANWWRSTVNVTSSQKTWRVPASTRPRSRHFLRALASGS